jgi:hypothetical protein
MRAQRLAAFLVLSSALVCACQLLVGVKDEIGSERSMGDGGPDSALESSSEGAACPVDSIGLASKPADGMEGAVKLHNYHFAFKSLDLGMTSVPPGFDLVHPGASDQDLATNGCIFPDGGSRATNLEGGVDNRTAALFKQISGPLPELGADHFNVRLQNGLFGMLVNVNSKGTVNDANVIVQFFPSLGLFSAAGKGGLIPGPPFQAAPMIVDGDASDQWVVDGRFNISANKSQDAWISNGKLVARFDQLTLPIRADEDLKLIDVVIRDAWMSADFSPADEPTHATLEHGIIGGRVIVAELLEQLRVLHVGVGDGGAYICSQSSAVAFARGLVCSSRDIPSSHCDDRLSKPCNAMSFGAGFEAYAVTANGPSKEQSPDYYANAGLLFPKDRCLGDADDDGGIVCGQ